MSSETSYQPLCQAGLVGPSGHPAMAPLAAPRIRGRVRLAYAQHALRDAIHDYVGMPLQRAALRHWMHNSPLAARIERKGLPRYALEEAIGVSSLRLEVDPRQLIRLAVRKPWLKDTYPGSSLRFIWDGNWDLRREDLRVGTRYRLIAELDEHRNDLRATQRFQELRAELAAGTPWTSHQLGISLDTEEKILHYLEIYLGFLDHMAQHGYDDSMSKDELGVAVSRDGKLLKINRGLHRLAMAQRLGLPTVPVRVVHVHRQYWDEVVQGAKGEKALARLRDALPACKPDTEPGPMDLDPVADLPENFWPAPRLSSQSA